MDTIKVGDREFENTNINLIQLLSSLNTECEKRTFIRFLWNRGQLDMRDMFTTTLKELQKAFNCGLPIDKQIAFNWLQMHGWIKEVEPMDKVYKAGDRFKHQNGEVYTIYRQEDNAALAYITKNHYIQTANGFKQPENCQKIKLCELTLFPEKYTPVD